MGLNVDVKNFKYYDIFEIKKLFMSSYFTQIQRDMLFIIVKVLGKHLIIDRNLLNHFAKEEFGVEKIGLSYIKKALDFNLIANVRDFKDISYYVDDYKQEYAEKQAIVEQSQSLDHKDKDYYKKLTEVEDAKEYSNIYTLDIGGANLLELADFEYSQFLIDDNYEIKEKVLVLNYNLLEKKYTLDFSKPSGPTYDYFYCLDNKNKSKILYFEEYITCEQVTSLVAKNFEINQATGEYESSNFDFETINFLPFLP